MSWVSVGDASQFDEGSVSELVVADRMVALSLVDGQFYAMDGLCPHQGGPLGQGSLNGCELQCPWHGLQFDVTSSLSRLGDQQTAYKTKVEEGQLLVFVESQSS